jgi:hypothetical protein
MTIGTDGSTRVLSIGDTGWQCGDLADVHGWLVGRALEAGAVTTKPLSRRQRGHAERYSFHGLRDHRRQGR